MNMKKTQMMNMSKITGGMGNRKGHNPIRDDISQYNKSRNTLSCSGGKEINMERSGKETLKQDLVFKELNIEYSPQSETAELQRKNEKRILEYAYGVKRLLYGTKEGGSV